MAEGKTWKEYFVDQALKTVAVNDAFRKYAEENGIEVSEEERTEFEEYVDQYEETVKQYGYESLDEALESLYGSGVTRELMIEDSINDILAQKAYSSKYQEILDALTEEDAAAYPRIDVRHILFMAVPSEDGTYTEQALKFAESRAKAALRLFEGTDKTEEDFAALASQFSEDPGSKDVGGLYSEVEPGTMVEEFNNFCFDESRQPGDTAIVYGSNGAYAGYHLMYFVGKSGEASYKAAADAKFNLWYEEVINSAVFEETEFCKYVG